MARFTGRLEGSGIEPSRVLIHIGEGRLRISSGRLLIGSWPLEEIETERVTLYKFNLDLGGHPFQFIPDDPSMFSNEVGAIIDLTEAGRFGLKARIEEAAAG